MASNSMLVIHGCGPHQNTIENGFGVQPDHTRPAICTQMHTNATSPPYPYLSPNSSRQLIAENYQPLWEDVTSTNDEGEAVRTLAGIVLNREGRAFVSNLERDDAELCIEILDCVSRDPYLLDCSPHHYGGDHICGTEQETPTSI